jgi:hypothetical protein
MKNSPIQALDGRIGSVSDFYFDDQLWTVRYLVADTGNWLPGRKALISPATVGDLRTVDGSFPVSLTKKQIEESPEIYEDLPVSRQREIELADHFGWPYYWAGHAAVAGAVSINYPPPIGSTQESKTAPKGADPHLRSANEVIGYHIRAMDGEIGHVEDFIAEADLWTIRYMVVDTRNWIPGKKVLVSPTWIKRVSWGDKQVQVDLLRKVIEECPEYNPSEPVNREYEMRLYDYCGRPKYWV